MLDGDKAMLAHQWDAKIHCWYTSQGGCDNLMAKTEQMR